MPAARLPCPKGTAPPAAASAVGPVSAVTVEPFPEVQP